MTYATIVNEEAWKTYRRWLELSEAAGSHRFLDNLVACRGFPNTSTLAKHANTHHSSWGELKRVLNEARKGDDFSQETLLKIFALFNKVKK